MMKVSSKAIDILKILEAFRSVPYLCSAGVPTIGYGSTRYEDGRHVTLNDTPISESQAIRLLYATLATEYEKAVNRYVQVVISQNEFDALTLLTYNIGTKAFQNSTLLKKLNLSDYVGAAGQFDEWIYEGKKKSRGLTKRRKLERSLFEAVI